MNLPNALTVGRIAATPLIAALPFAKFVGRSFLRLPAVYDRRGDRLHRRPPRTFAKEETDLGRILDPLADKLLLIGTFVPMYLLASKLPFHTPLGSVGLSDGWLAS